MILMMRKFNLICSFVLLTFVSTSCNKDKVEVEVIKDCTGVYLRANGSDSKVCNEYLLDSYASGTKLKVNYDVLEQCYGLQEEPSCSDVHVFSQLVEITEIF